MLGLVLGCVRGVGGIVGAAHASSLLCVFEVSVVFGEQPIPSIPVDSLGVFIVLFIPLGEIARPNETMRGKVR